MTAAPAVVFLAFIVGTAIGSFINVIALRYGTHKSWLWNRSACPACGRQLTWWELVPLVSFLALRGRCRRCRAKINPRYFFVEALCGLLTALAFIPVPATPMALLVAICIAAIVNILVLLALIDAHTMLLPDPYILALSAFTVAALLLQPERWHVATAGGALAGSGFLLLLWLGTRGRGIGLGDVKLMVPVGALVGVGGVVTLFFIAFCVGGTIGLLLLARGKATMKTALPFGPFLAGAAIIVVLFPQLTEHFFSLLLLQ